jgi:hypothetical protein
LYDGGALPNALPFTRGAASGTDDQGMLIATNILITNRRDLKAKNAVLSF